ncbi:MAG: hypothetical protein AAGC93_18840 [Cyanobacteria bacterium P01_F01_bin.53]
MIKTHHFNNRAIEAALYYVRLKTHNGSLLFGCPEEQAEVPSVAVPSGDGVTGDAMANVTGSVTGANASLSQIVADELLFAAKHRGISLDQWVIVPDAVHALVFVRENRPDPEVVTGKPRLLTSFVAGFKAATAKRINLIRNQPGSSVWQRSYNEQLVEDEFMLMRLRKRISDAESVVISSAQVLSR